MKRIIKAGLCLMRDGQVLLARSRGDTHFQIPGGKIEPGESDIDALIREVQEELAVTLVPDSAAHMAIFEAKAAGRIDVLVEVRLYNGTVDGIPQASSEIAELVWQSPAAPTVPCSDVVRLHILPYLARCLSEQGRTPCQP
ncbi:NUDIX domain-containing protein [Roseobacter sp.]|uniref:NUDIX hydrolase n=1 Tax=Roseobacter sp. TaxID=1907202 RepID=UPI003298C09D